MDLSVALATYNGGKYLREQLDSIRRQTLLPAEVVICDDGSSDDTLEIVRQFAADAPFKVVVDAHGQRLGFTRNFLRAIERCEGEIVVLCDQDDVWDERKLAVASQPFSDKNVATVTHLVRVVDEHLRPTGLALPPPEFLGRFERCRVDPWFAPNGMQLLFRRAPILPWLRGTPPFSAYGHGTAPFDEWIYCAGSLTGVSVVINDVLGVWRRHGAVASMVMDNVARDNSSAHQLHLALHSGGEAYAFRAEVTDSRAEYVSRSIVLPDGTTAPPPVGAVEFYQEMSRMFRRRVRLHDPATGLMERLKTFVGMLGRNDYRSRHGGGLGKKAVLKDAFTIFFGPRTAVG